MKGKKILAGALSAAMVLAAMVVPAFADDSNGVEYNGTTYATFEDARAAVTDTDTEITYTIHGKVTMPQGGINNLTGAATAADTVHFVAAENDAAAELALEASGHNYIGLDMNNKALKTVTYKDLTLSRTNGSYMGDIGHANNYFTTALRSAGTDGLVTYTGCTFPNGSCNNFYGKTQYTDCEFENDSEYALWVYGGETKVSDSSFTGAKGVKVYSEDATEDVKTTIKDSTFDSITKKPAVVSSTKGTVILENIETINCANGLLQTEPKDERSDLPCADVTVDGKAPAYVAKVGTGLYTDMTYAEKVAADEKKDVEKVVAKVGDTYYSSIDDAVAAAQAETTDKWHISKITLLTNDELDISKGPENYVSYNITKDDTVITGERLVDDAHKSYYQLTNASTLYIPADVSSIILSNVVNLCKIELAKGADVTLKINGTNEIAGYITVPEGAKLTIEDITADGTGKLAVYNTTTKEYAAKGMNAFGAGSGYNAAIGGTQTQAGGEIVIKSGEIEAYSNYGSAIGGGQQKSAKVTILGGKIKAEASYGCAIGGGQQSAGDVTISGGVIDAKSDRSAPIGGGQKATTDSNITITGGDITVARDFGKNMFGNSDGEPIGATISGGKFNTDVSDYCEDGFSPKLVDGKYVVDETADKIALKFVKTAEKVYDIVLSGDGQNINRLNTADFTFAIDNNKITYTLAAAEKMSLTPTDDPNRYEFHFNGKTGVTTDTDDEIKIGTVTFDGYGAFKFNVADAATNLVTATTKDDNLVTEFVVGAAAGKGTLVIDDAEINTELTVPTNKLTVNITFPNAIGSNDADYQKMKATIAGGDCSEEIALGTMTDGAYKIEKDLAENTPYTVTVSGEGYRTTRYTVTLNSDKILNFWNNAKDNAAEVEVGNPSSAKNVTFLAGDIVKDNEINIYDLSAVVSYFGMDNLVSAHPEYAKYDLNRDGKIDSKDVAYVLVSWGK